MPKVTAVVNLDSLLRRQAPGRSARARRQRGREWRWPPTSLRLTSLHLTSLRLTSLRLTSQEIRDRGCDQVALCTHSFQAPDFYARYGYRERGRIPAYPRGHDQIQLV